MKKEQDDKLRQYLSRKNPDEMKRRIAALSLRKTSAYTKRQPLIQGEDVDLPSAEDVLKYSTVFDTSFLEEVQHVYLDSKQMTDLLATRRSPEDELQKFKLTDCLPLNDEQHKQPPPPGYISASVNLKNSPVGLKVEHLHSVKLLICNVLQVQPYAVILCGFREGSTVVEVFVAKRLKQELHQKAPEIAFSCLDKKSNDNSPVSVSTTVFIFGYVGQHVHVKLLRKSTSLVHCIIHITCTTLYSHTLLSGPWACVVTHALSYCNSLSILIFHYNRCNKVL